MPSPVEMQITLEKQGLLCDGSTVVEFPPEGVPPGIFFLLLLVKTDLYVFTVFGLVVSFMAFDLFYSKHFVHCKFKVCCIKLLCNNIDQHGWIFFSQIHVCGILIPTYYMRLYLHAYGRMLTVL